MVSRRIGRHGAAHPVPSIGVVSRPLAAIVVELDGAQADSGDAKHLDVISDGRWWRGDARRQ